MWKPIYVFEHISIGSSQKEKLFETKIVEKMQTHLTFDNIFFSKNLLLMS
jgi:hypothetical protein